MHEQNVFKRMTMLCHRLYPSICNLHSKVKRFSSSNCCSN